MCVDIVPMWILIKGFAISDDSCFFEVLFKAYTIENVKVFWGNGFIRLTLKHYPHLRLFREDFNEA